MSPTQAPTSKRGPSSSPAAKSPGAPPDALSANGQHWGNPLYDWPVHRATGYHWWIERFRRVFELVDLTRVDHFRGFVSYWAIPAHRTTARSGRWRRGPGAELFRTVEHALGELPVIAEDLGVITPAVRRVRDELHLPGTVVLLWAFRAKRSNPHAPRNHRVNQVAYTSTHDTDTVVGWFESLRRTERVATGLDPGEPNWGLIEIAMQSRAALAIVPAQDVLGLGSEARMNRPGETYGNWSWRLERGQLTDALATRLRAASSARQALTALAAGGRCASGISWPAQQPGDPDRDRAARERADDVEPEVVEAEQDEVRSERASRVHRGAADGARPEPREDDVAADRNGGERADVLRA